MAGNPAVSTPNSDRLAAALERLDFMVSVDIYLNETTRHADVILPAPSPLQRSHYDVALLGFAVRNVANYSPPVLAPDPDMPAEWETLLRLTGVVTGQGPNADVAALDRFVALETARRQTADAHSPVHGRDPEELLAEVAPRVGPRADPRPAPARRALPADAGRARGGAPRDRPRPAGAAHARGAAHRRAARSSSRPSCWSPTSRACTRRWPSRSTASMVLVGRRDLRSNNSWMHNLPMLVSGKQRCTAHVHPDDAERLGLVDGEAVGRALARRRPSSSPSR